jgi:hypothetical protein
MQIGATVKKGGPLGQLDWQSRGRRFDPGQQNCEIPFQDIFTPYITLIGEGRCRRPPTIYIRVMGVNAKTSRRGPRALGSPNSSHGHGRKGVRQKQIARENMAGSRESERSRTTSLQEEVGKRGQNMAFTKALLQNETIAPGAEKRLFPNLDVSKWDRLHFYIGADARTIAGLCVRITASSLHPHAFEASLTSPFPDLSFLTIAR